MPSLGKNPTTVKTMGRSQQQLLLSWALASLYREPCEGHTDTPQQTLPIESYMWGVIDIGSIFKQISALSNGEEADEEGQVKPTQYAVNRICSLLVDTCSEFHVKFPSARVAPDLEGGLRIEWRLPKGVVRIIVPPRESDKEYLYSRVNGQSKTEFSLSGALIASWLEKVM